MSSPDNQYEELAQAAAKRIGESRALAEQLSLLPSEPNEDGGIAGGKAARGKGKVFNQMREWLAQKGYRAPEDVLAEMAGLASREDAILTAMVQAERILAWAGEGAANRIFKVGVGHVDLEGPWTPSPAEKLAVFQQLYATMLRAADALMPYGAPKATPDVTQTNVTNITVQAPSAPAQPVRAGEMARDVTPQARRMAPPPMPHQVQQKQEVTECPAKASDAEGRTK